MKAARPMACREFRGAGTAYLERALSRSDRLRFEAHCRDCAACREEWTRFREVVGRLGELRSPVTGSDTGIVSAPDPAVAAAVDLFRHHGLHVGAVRPRDIPLGIGHNEAAAGDHIAFLWETEGEFMATSGYLASGLARDEACLLLGHEAANRRVLEGLARHGMGARDVRRRDRLQVASPATSSDALLAKLDRHIKSAVERGLPGVRILGNLGWGELGWPADDEILRLEARVTAAVGRYPSVVLCAYDVGRLPGRILLKGGLECHPVILRRDTLRINDSYVPAEQFLTGLKPRPRR
jgi:DcmR-like sensory protein